MSPGLERLRQFTIYEWWLMARVWMALCVLSVLVKMCGVPRLLRLCALGAPRPPADETLVVACVDRMLQRHPGLPDSPCLKRSLALYRYLGATATDLQFCLGVRYADGPRPRQGPRRLSGHAWLRRNGVPYLEANHRGVEQFRLIYCYPARGENVA